MQKQPRLGEYTLAELVIAANKRITKEKIKPADPRAKATVTARTVQFYLSKGLLPEPARRGAQLRFDERHVDAVVEVKRRQADGLMLDEIVDKSKRTNVDWNLAPIALDNLIPYRSSRSTNWDSLAPRVSNLGGIEDQPSPPVFKWHVALGAGLELSGRGVTPTPEQIARVKTALGANHELDNNDNKEQ